MRKRIVKQERVDINSVIEKDNRFRDLYSQNIKLTMKQMKCDYVTAKQIVKRDISFGLMKVELKMLENGK